VAVGGTGALAPYAYDWIDNADRRSPRELAGFPEPRSGERFTTAGGRELGRNFSGDRGKQLTGTMMGPFMSWCPRISAPPGSCSRSSCSPSQIAPALCVGDLIMARRQLLNLKQLTEHHLHNNMAVD
jgi:hypothetical protein